MAEVTLNFLKKEKNPKKEVTLNFLNEPNLSPGEEQKNETTSSDPTLGKLGAGLATEVIIAESGRMASSFLGPVGYIAGAFASGIAGSYAAQKITNPDDISEGRLLADGLINLIPGMKAAKGRNVYADAAIRQGSIGAAIGAGGIALEKGYDEGRMPTIEELQGAGITAGALGSALGLTGAAVNRFLRKYQGVENRDWRNFDLTADPADKTFMDRVRTLRRKNRSAEQEAFDEGLLAARERFTDASIRQRRLQDTYGEGQGNVGDGGPLKVQELEDKTGFWTNPKDNSNIFGKEHQDYYANKRTAEGKMDYQMETILKEEQLYLDELGKIGARTNGITPKEATKDIDRYLHAKYALDYNKLRGDGQSGMTNSSANDIIKQFEGAGLKDLYRNPIKILKDQNARASKLAVESGLVSEAQMKKWKKEYGDNYVPLTRVLDNDKSLLKSQNPNEVKSIGIYEDVGSDLQVRSIKQNIQENLADVIRRAELNKVNQSFARLVDANKLEANAILKQTNNKNYAEGVGGKDSTLTFYNKGKAYNMEFKDKTLARAFKGAPIKDMSAITKGIFNISTSINRYLGSIYTRFNPDFVIPNLFRDSSEATLNNMARMGAKSAASLKSTSNPFSVFDKKAIYKKLNGKPPANAQEAEIHKLYDEFKEDGGSVGGLGATTQQELTDKIKDIAKRLQTGTPDSHLRKLGAWFDKANNIFEDGTRFKTYMMARRAGFSRGASAISARDSSFDPRLGGTDVGLIRATYLFANPAIQANKVFLKNMFNNPKVAIPALAATTALLYNLDNWNSSIEPDWEEKLKTTTGSNFTKNKSLVFVTGVDEESGKLQYIAMPIGYSMIPFKVMADYTQKSFRPDTPLSKEFFRNASSDIKDQFIEAYNPVGASIIPTPLRGFSELAFNEDGLGRTIRPEWLEGKNMASKEKMYSFTMDTNGGEMAYALAETAEALNMEVSPESIKHIWKMFTGGPVATVDRLVDATVKLYKGEELRAKDIPILRRFMGEGYKEKFEDRAGKLSEIEEFTAIDNTERARDSRIASRIYREMKDSTPEEAQAALQRAMTEGILTPSVQKRLISKINNAKLKLTPAEARAKQLSVPLRAKYLLQQMKNMSLDDLPKYLQEQTNKGLLTKPVIETLSQLDEFKNLTLQDLK